MFRRSPSQIKTFKWSKQKRAAEKILWIRDEYSNDNYIVWQIWEDYLLKWLTSIEDIIGNQKVEDMEKVIQDVEAIKINAKWLDFDVWKTQVKAEWLLLWHSCCGYIDNLTDERIDEIKTAKYLSKVDWAVNMWSNMSTYEEYELQVWVYMKLLDRKKARIIEVAKHLYKDWVPRNQIIEFHMTPEFDEKMISKFQPVIDEMSEMMNKFSKVREEFVYNKNK